MGSYPWRHLLIGFVILGVLVASPATISSVTAKAPPEPVCGVCTSSLDEAARERGVTINRGKSTMTVDLYENGTAKFNAHVQLETGAERLQNQTLREAIVRDVSYVLADERQHLQTELNGNTLIVRYDSSDVAHTTLGVLQFDAFQTRGAPPFASGGEGAPYPGADTLTIRGPTGFELHGSHGEYHNETAVVWHSESDEQYSGDIEEDVVISFVPEDARLPTVRTIMADFFDWTRSLGI